MEFKLAASVGFILCPTAYHKNASALPSISRELCFIGPGCKCLNQMVNQVLERLKRTKWTFCLEQSISNVSAVGSLAGLRFRASTAGPTYMVRTELCFGPCSDASVCSGYGIASGIRGKTRRSWNLAGREGQQPAIVSANCLPEGGKFLDSQPGIGNLNHLMQPWEFNELGGFSHIPVVGSFTHAVAGREVAAVVAVAASQVPACIRPELGCFGQLLL